MLNILLFIRDQAGRLSFRDLTPATTIQATKEFPLKIDKTEKRLLHVAPLFCLTFYLLIY